MIRQSAGRQYLIVYQLRQRLFAMGRAGQALPAPAAPVLPQVPVLPPVLHHQVRQAPAPAAPALLQVPVRAGVIVATSNASHPAEEAILAVQAVIV